jgi:hypothetical protein
VELDCDRLMGWTSQVIQPSAQPVECKALWRY